MKHGITFENCERTIRRLVINEYATKHHLSKRETEILETLVDGATNTSDLSKNLGISPNTTNNHLKRMMDKTGNSSKLDLITKFYKFMMARLATAYLYSKKPKIFVIDSDEEFGQVLVDDLRLRGMHTFFESNTTAAIDRVAEIYPDFVILDQKVPYVEEKNLLKKIRDQLPHEPFIIVLSQELRNEATLLNEGAAAVLAKPFSFVELFNTIVDLYSDPPVKGLRLSRVGTDMTIRLQPEDIEVRVQNLGYGGAFLKVSPTRLDLWAKLNGCEEFTLPLSLGEHHIEMACTIAWRRPNRNIEGPAGVGVKFSNATPDDLRIIRDYVRSKRLKTFIPNT